jgi:CheY-like chemotaxis protein
MDRILIIDDDTNSRIVAGNLLNDLGYAVSFAANGWEGLLTVGKTLPDLIILRLVMPGIDGAMFLKILRSEAHRQRVPVVLMVGLEADECELSVTIDGVIAVLHKERKDFSEKLALVADEILPLKRDQKPQRIDGWIQPF